jgi:hypothetical protein
MGDWLRVHLALLARQARNVWQQRADHWRFLYACSCSWNPCSLAGGHQKLTPLLPSSPPPFVPPLFSLHTDVPSFVQTPLVANYVCLHPQLQQYSEILTAYPKPLEIETRPIPQLSARSGLGPLGSEILTLGVGHRGAKKHSVGEGENVFVPWDNKVGNAVFWVSFPICRVRFDGR